MAGVFTDVDDDGGVGSKRRMKSFHLQQPYRSNSITALFCCQRQKNNSVNDENSNAMKR